jgi:hypothetical protein
MTRGGYRPGAGRPRQKNNRVKVGYVVAPETAEWIKQQAEEKRVGQGRILDELIKSMQPPK